MQSLVPCLLLSALAAQTTVVLPPSVATSPPASATASTPNLFYSTTSTTTPHDSRCQLIYMASDVGVPATLWRSLAVRRPANVATMNNAFTTNARIVMSTSPLPYGAMTATFANNHGAAPTTVLNGPISLPARAQPPSWPAPWETPFQFTTPFVFVQSTGLSLVVDVLQTGNSATTAWLVEASFPDGGTRTSNPGAQQGCRFSNGNYNNAIGYQLPTVGAPWYVNYQPLPPNLVGVGALGLQGAGGMWGGIPLPLSLAPFGAPGCSWNVSVELTVPLSSTTTVYQWPTLQIPADPTLAGQSFYDHAMILDPAANAWGVVTTWSSRWTFATNPGASAALLAATGSAALGATGTLRGQVGVSLQLNP